MTEERERNWSEVTGEINTIKKSFFFFSFVCTLQKIFTWKIWEKRQRDGRDVFPGVSFSKRKRERERISRESWWRFEKGGGHGDGGRWLKKIFFCLSNFPDLTSKKFRWRTSTRTSTPTLARGGGGSSKKVIFFFFCLFSFQCNNCQKPLLQPHQRLNFYSDYSHSLACPHCQASDTHFVKPLGLCYTKDLMSLWP